jgi:zinc protease
MSTSSNKNFKPEEYYLSNGIPVILQHLDGSVGTFHWWNLTGSTDEKPEEAGFAHFLEHMLFKDSGAKDSGQASTGKLAKAIESLGGEVNAYTTFDQTVYHVTCSEQYWEQAVDQFSTMAQPQQFLKDDFEREREVILEELRRGEDSPDRQLYQALFSLTYKKHPYFRPVIGYVKTLKAANVKMLEAFYRRQYVSSQMGLVLVGPLHDGTGARKKKLLSILEKRLGKLKIAKKPLPKRIRPIEPVLSNGFRFKAKNFDINTPQFAASFRIPELMHHDVPHLEVLSGVLGMGDSSRLYQKLFYDKSLVSDVSTSVYVPRDPGMFLFSAELKKTEDLREVCKTFCEERNRLISEKVAKSEIERVITNIESDKLYSTQTVDGLAGRLGFLKFSLGDLNFDAEYIEHVKSVTPQTLKNLAQQYLDPNRMSAALFQPNKETLLDISEVAPGFEALTSPPKAAVKIKTKTKKEALEPEIFTTSSGVRVAYFEKVGSPVFSLHSAAMGGSRLELLKPAPFGGVSHLLSQTWAKGTPRYNSKELSNIIESSAASLDGFSGRNTIGLQSTGLVRDWNKLSDLFQEVLLTPTFADDELQHAKRVTEDAIKSIPDHSSQVCSKLFMENLFPNHPYGKHLLGTQENLSLVTRDHLAELHQEWITPKNMTLTLVGGVHKEEFQEWLTDLDSKLATRNGISHKTEKLKSEAALTAPRWAYANFSREQTHIMMGGLGLSMYDPERYALKILQNILGGQSGRLFIELREKKSMAYSVAPLGMEGVEPGYVGTYIACAPHKKDEAIAGMKTVLENLILKGPTTAELERAKNYYLGQRAMDLQSTWSLASSFGLELLYRDRVILESEIRKEIEKITAKQVQKIGEKLFLNNPHLTVVVS